jgi:putative NIF3 family GTP cyclohydrolase 1 type 2
VKRVAVVTGSGGRYLIEAAHAGYDALVTGEPEEPSLATARELGIHLVAGGHYATERLGVQALTARLADEFGVPWVFLEVENPV